VRLTPTINLSQNPDQRSLIRQIITSKTTPETMAILSKSRCAPYKPLVTQNSGRRESKHCPNTTSVLGRRLSIQVSLIEAPSANSAAKMPAPAMSRSLFLGIVSNGAIVAAQPTARAATIVMKSNKSELNPTRRYPRADHFPWRGDFFPGR
jgi:hypothetical protein